MIDGFPEVPLMPRGCKMITVTYEPVGSAAFRRLALTSMRIWLARAELDVEIYARRRSYYRGPGLPEGHQIQLVALPHEHVAPVTTPANTRGPYR
jgi:hypothetical protein